MVFFFAKVCAGDKYGQLRVKIILLDGLRAKLVDFFSIKNVINAHTPAMKTIVLQTLKIAKAIMDINMHTTASKMNKLFVIPEVLLNNVRLDIQQK